MAATKEIIREWMRRGKKENATHLIVVCDTYDYDDYPVFVKSGEDPKSIESQISGKNMQRVMEVYNLNMDIDSQLNSHRSFNY